MSRAIRFALLSGAVIVNLAFGITPQDLSKAVADGQPITIIDVRPATLFKNSHIPGAINIPEVLIPEKQLPPMGHVVVYDQGKGKQAAVSAAAALNQKPGIRAEVLEGGFAGWEEATRDTTAPHGMQPEQLPLVTYADLKKSKAGDLLLVDLRKPRKIKTTAAADPAPFTDLKAEFPNALVTHSPFGTASGRRQSNGAAAPLLVLIDNNDGSAEEAARALKANGVTRFAILAGGEEILAHKGEPGLKRSGSSFTVTRPTVNGATNSGK